MIYEKLTDAALADRLLKVAGKVSALPPAERAELLTEAARRLVESEARLDKFKTKVRDFAIKQADRRGWCGEFDSIISQLGIAGRFSNYRVTISYKRHDGISTYRDPKFIYVEESKTCIARDEEHAGKLVYSYFNRQGYQDIKVTKTEMVSNILGAANSSVEGHSASEF